jgi:hypothetical protein
MSRQVLLGFTRCASEPCLVRRSFQTSHFTIGNFMKILWSALHDYLQISSDFPPIPWNLCSIARSSGVPGLTMCELVCLNIMFYLDIPWRLSTSIMFHHAFLIVSTSCCLLDWKVRFSCELTRNRAAPWWSALQARGTRHSMRTDST